MRIAIPVVVLLLSFPVFGQETQPVPVPVPEPTVAPAPEPQPAPVEPVVTPEVQEIADPAPVEPVVPVTPAPEPEPEPMMPMPEKNPDWPEEPEGFANQLFGTLFEDMPSSMTGGCKNRVPRTAEEPVRICTNPSFPVTPSIRCIGKFEYSKGASGEIIFSGVELHISNRNIEKVKDVMVEKYGRPHDRDREDKLTRGQAVAVALFGGPTTNPRKVTDWYGVNVNITLTETEDPFGRSKIEIRHGFRVKAEAEESAF